MQEGIVVCLSIRYPARFFASVFEEGWAVRVSGYGSSSEARTLASARADPLAGPSACLPEGQPRSLAPVGPSLLMETRARH